MTWPWNAVAVVAGLVSINIVLLWALHRLENANHDDQIRRDAARGIHRLEQHLDEHP